MTTSPATPNPAEELARVIYAYTPLMGIVQDAHNLADAIIKAGWVGPDAATDRETAAVTSEREAWIQRLATLCDDDWLRRRDRCMGSPGASRRHDREASGAWEHAAHVIRSLLNEYGYEDEFVNRHSAYMQWINQDRDIDEPRRYGRTDR